MLMASASLRVFLARDHVDFRRGFDGLAALTQSVIGQDPLSGHLFVFVNRRRDRMKVLYWDRSGYCLWYKRLEAGVFRMPAGDAASAEISVDDLLLVLQGVDPAQVRRGKRFSLPRPDALAASG